VKEGYDREKEDWDSAYITSGTHLSRCIIIELAAKPKKANTSRMIFII